MIKRRIIQGIQKPPKKQSKIHIRSERQRAPTPRKACLDDSIMVSPTSCPEILLKMNLLRRKWNLHRANHNLPHLPTNLRRKIPIMNRKIMLPTLQLQTLGNPPLPLHKRATFRGPQSPLQIEDLVSYTVIRSMTIQVNSSMAALKMMAFGKIIYDG